MIRGYEHIRELLSTYSVSEMNEILYYIKAYLTDNKDIKGRYLLELVIDYLDEEDGLDE